MKRLLSLMALVGVIAAVLLPSGCGKQTDRPHFSAGAVGGIESITVDGRRYFFGYSHRDDRVLTPLFDSEGAIAEHAASHMAQTDGRHDAAFWSGMAKAAISESELTDAQGQSIALAPLKAAVAELRRDPTTARPLSGIVLPEHLYYLLEMNCDWPDEDVPAPVVQAARRLGLDDDDTSPWMEISGGVLSGAMPLPKGATFQDAATVYLWYLDSLVGHQRYGWSASLELP
ncbi:MAG: hypothetical protein HOQ32_12725 [Lysobacter sp.]|nr:hypothetical protein [Lysobacter sp.]